MFVWFETRNTNSINPRIKGGKANCSSIIGTLRTGKLTSSSSGASFTFSAIYLFIINIIIVLAFPYKGVSVAISQARGPARAPTPPAPPRETFDARERKRGRTGPSQGFLVHHFHPFKWVLSWKGDCLYRRQKDIWFH